jgi:transcriptional regulator with XRE-family HTH domain
MNAFAFGLKILLVNSKKKDVAEKCGMSSAQLSNIMNGKNIQIETIERVSVGLGLDVSEIFKKGEEFLKSNENKI